MKKINFEIGPNLLAVLIIIILMLCSVLKGKAQNRAPGTKVTSAIVPNDLRDDMATHVDTLGYGGFRSVSTKAEMYGIKASRRTVGMRVYVRDTKVDSVFVLKGGLTNAHWVPVPDNAFQQETFFVTTNPLNWEGFKYPYPIPTYDAGKPIPFRTPFKDVSYSLLVSCYSNNGIIPYIITDRKPESFTIKIVESCICSYTANKQ